MFDDIFDSLFDWFGLESIPDATQQDLDTSSDLDPELEVDSFPDSFTDDDDSSRVISFDDPAEGGWEPSDIDESSSALFVEDTSFELEQEFVLGAGEDSDVEPFSVELESQRFMVEADESTGLGDEDAYSAEVTVAPNIELPGNGTVRIILGDEQVTAEGTVQDQGNGLDDFVSDITTDMQIAPMDSPHGLVKRVEVTFDNGENFISDIEGAGTYDFDIPENASRLESVKVSWEWEDNHQDLTFSANIKCETVLAEDPINGTGELINTVATVGGVGVGLLGQQILRPKENKDKIEKLKIYFSRIDPCERIHDAFPWQLVRLVASRNRLNKDSEEENLIATLIAQGTNSSLEIKLVKWHPDSRLFVSEPILLMPSSYTSTIGEPHLTVTLNSSITATVNSCPSELPIIPHPPILINDISFTGYRLEFIGENASVIDLQASINNKINETLNNKISVQFTDEFGDPIPDAQLSWRLSGHPEALMTITDEEGISEISFMPSINGDFAAFEDEGLPLSENIKPIKYNLTVLPTDEEYFQLLETPPVEVQLDLVAPTQLYIVDEDYNPLPFLYDGQEFYLLISVGRREEKYSPLNYIGLTPYFYSEPKFNITYPNGNKEERLLSPNLFQDAKNATGYRIALTAIAAHDEEFIQDKAILTKYPSDIHFEFAGQNINIPVYSNQVRGQLAALYEVFNRTRYQYLEIRKSSELSDDLRRVFDLKSKLLANAMAWFDEPIWSGDLSWPVVLGFEYLNLIKMQYTALLGSYKAPKFLNNLPQEIQQIIRENSSYGVSPCWPSNRNTRITYACEAERIAIDRALIKLGTQGFSKCISANLIAAQGAFEFTCPIPVATYTIWTGYNLEGQKANTIELFFSGVELLPVLGMLGGLARFGRFGKAARALQRQSRFFRKLNSNLVDIENLSFESAFQKGKFTSTATSADQLKDRLLDFISQSKDARLLNKFRYDLEKLKDVINLSRKNIRLRKNELASLRRQLADKLRQRRSRIRKGDRYIKKTWNQELRRNRRGIDRKSNALRKEQEKLAKQLVRYEISRINLDTLLEGRCLEIDHLRFLHTIKELPAYKDTFGGRQTTRIYERFVQFCLEKTDEISAFRKGQWRSFFKREIRVLRPYHTVQYGPRLHTRRDHLAKQVTEMFHEARRTNPELEFEDFVRENNRLKQDIEFLHWDRVEQRFIPKYRKQFDVAQPELDHLFLSEKSLAAADSKWFVDWPNSAEVGLGDILTDDDIVTRRVKQVIDSIEKGRKVQFEILYERALASGHSKSLKEIWHNVCQQEFIIITPTKVPDYFENMVRASVGKAGQNISFLVIKPDLSIWADLLSEGKLKR